METYIPKKFSKPEKMIPVVTAWAGLEEIIEDILDRFDIGRDACIEFGVEFGYSSVVFSNYFKQVTGVDVFIGDEHTDFKGDHFQMDDCRMLPMPQKKIPIICAGQSTAGMEFSAQHADYNFCFGKGVNTPTAFAPTAERLIGVAQKAGRKVGSVVLIMVIADETDEKAMAKWELYKDGKDQSALDWMTDQGAVDKKSGKDTNIRDMTDPTSAVNLNMGTLVGSFASVAAMLDEIDTVPGCEGVLLTFDDFIQGMDDYGQKIQPLMTSRQHITSSAVA